MGRLPGTALSLRSKGDDNGEVFLTAPSTRNAFSVVFYGWRASGGSVAWASLGLRYRRPVMTMLYKNTKQKIKGTLAFGDSE